MSYTPLHCHSDASLLDGLSKTSRIAERIKDIDADACALTDHGSIANCVSFLTEMKKAGKKPILGCELYICDQDASVRSKENRYLAHLPVLAKNTHGWNQLVKAVSESNKPEHYYHRPRLSVEQLSKYCDGGIIGFSGHLGSHVSDAIEAYGVKGGIKAAEVLEECFGKGNFWLECQLMDQIVTPKQLKITKAVREISKTTGIPCIATPDAHYSYKEDAILQRILLCSNMGTNFEKGKADDFGMNTFFKSDCFHIPSHEEMVEYGHTEDELNNTNVILSQIEDYDILKAPMLKKFPCPDGRTPDEQLRHLCREGWRKLVQPKISKERQKEYTARIKVELDVFENAKLASYFLMVQDIVQYCNDQGWLMGPGRGSAAGCLVSYLIGITKIDPMKYDLMFERFYNDGRNTEGRVSMPDIDVDVPIQHRGEIIEYIKSKYGEDCVSQMVTFQTMKGKKALTETFRAFGDTSFEEIKEMTKDIPDEAKIADKLQEMEHPSILRWCLENRKKQFKEWCEIDKEGNLTGEYAERFGLAIRLEGTKSAQSKHAAGIVVSPRPLAELCPMVYDSKTKRQVAGMEMNDLESLGLIKFDILGVAMLDKIMWIKVLLARQGIDFDFDMETFDMDCEKTWELLGEGNSKGVFQLESRFGQKECGNLQPENMEQLAALSAILRPGSADAKKEDGITIKDHYIMKKNKKEEVTYIDEVLRPILATTYGEMIYQEQAMAIARDLAGFDLKQADILRKAIGKKKPEIMAQVKKEFIEGCKEQNVVDEQIAAEVFDWIEKSQRYSFNKSHAVSYAYNSYLSAYCKAHYKKEFFTAYLKFAHNSIKPQEEIYELVNNAKAMDLFVKPPNIQHLNAEFDLICDDILFGLCDVKNVGTTVIDKLEITAKQVCDTLHKGDFTDFTWLEFLVHVAPTIKINSLESLINVGACDCFDMSRTEMLFQSNIIRELSKSEIKWIFENWGQITPETTLRDLLVIMISLPAGRKGACSNKNRLAKVEGLLNTLDNPPYTMDDKPHIIAGLESELLGVNLTATMLDECKTKYKANCSCVEYNKGYGKGGEKIVVATRVDGVKKIKTKRGKNPGQEMAFLEASDETGSIDSVVVFPEYWEEYKNMIVAGNRLLLCGKRDEKEQKSFILELVEQL